MVVDQSQFSGAMQQAMAINEAAKTAQANKVSCMAMNHRIQIATEVVKAAFERHQQQVQLGGPRKVAFPENAFKNYMYLLDRMKDFVLEISKKKTFSKLFYALRYRDEFDALLREFDNCVMELNLGIALRTQAQLETDRNALEEDMVELKVFRKDLQNGLDSLGGQLVGIRQMIATNRPMDDILASVELDYNQVLPIAPAETRRGRTFPVHKRSWLAQEVAEKPLGFFGSQDMLDMLKSEVAILKKLDRCNYITRFMGVTNKNNQISIIMEWLPNGDLASALAKDKMDWEEKLFIAADIARGLQFLHEVGIIHKTLRAKNILLTRHNQAKITNFRQSRLESAQTRPMSDPFSFVRWLAPEKMTPKEVRYGAECDIYSFGMLLFEIASNRIPFESRSDRELPELIVLKDFYETVPTGTPTEFANIMSACWSHDPRLRPTVSQVLLILRDACVKYENGEQNFGGLPANLKKPPPLFAILPPEVSEDGNEVYPISPPMTPIGSRNGHLTPEVWNNPYVNKRYVEESLEELRRNQQQISQVPTPIPPSQQSQPPPQRPLQQQPPQSSPLPPRQQQQQPVPTPPQSQPAPQTQAQGQQKALSQNQTQEPIQNQSQQQTQQQAQRQAQIQKQLLYQQQLQHQLQLQQQPSNSQNAPPVKANTLPIPTPSMLTPPMLQQQQHSPKPRPATLPVPGLSIPSKAQQQQQQQQTPQMTPQQQQQNQQQQVPQMLQQHNQLQPLSQQPTVSPLGRVHSAGSTASKEEYVEHQDGTVIKPRQQPPPLQHHHQSFSSNDGSSPRPTSFMSPVNGGGHQQQSSSPGFASAQSQGPMSPINSMSPPSSNIQQGSAFENQPPLVNKNTRPLGLKPKRIGGGPGAPGVQPLDINMNGLLLHDGSVTTTPTASTPTTAGSGSRNRMTGGSHDLMGGSMFSPTGAGNLNNGFHNYNHNNHHQQHQNHQQHHQHPGLQTNGSYHSQNGSTSSSSPRTSYSSPPTHGNNVGNGNGISHSKDEITTPLRPTVSQHSQQHSSTNLMIDRPVSPNPHNNPNTMSRALRLHENQERERAWVIFKSFHDQGNVEGMYWTAYYLFHGEGGQLEDKRRAFEIFLAVTRLDLLIQSPTVLDGLTQHQQQQRLHYQRLASNAHFYTAVCFLEGQGIERNHVTGFGHMEMAADSGNAFAQFLVGDAYHKGSAVVQQNVARRNHYWQLAARQREQRAVDQCRKFGIPI